MRIVVNDSCALIDLKKGRVLDLFLDLPFKLIVPDIILGDELLSFTKPEVNLMRRKMTVGRLEGQQVGEAEAMQRANPALSFHDCAAFVLVLGNPGAMLLTGDRRLRERAVSAGVTCHGVLWAVEEMAKANLGARERLIAALEIWRGDELVRLPRRELDKTLRRLKQ